jgi:hypothetical protein
MAISSSAMARPFQILPGVAAVVIGIGIVRLQADRFGMIGESPDRTAADEQMGILEREPSAKQ